MSIASFFRDLFGSSNNTSPTSVSTPPRAAIDPINPPPSESDLLPCINELYSKRGYRPALGLAIASKVGAWRLLYQMGSPQAIPWDFREWIIKAENERNTVQKIAIYCTIQNVIFNNFDDPEAVKRL